MNDLISWAHGIPWDAMDWRGHSSFPAERDRLGLISFSLVHQQDPVAEGAFDPPTQIASNAPSFIPKLHF